MLSIYNAFPVLIGMHMSDAIPLIKAAGFVFRMHYSDAYKNDLGNLFVQNRVNLKSCKGIIVGYTFS